MSKENKNQELQELVDSLRKGAINSVDAIDSFLDLFVSREDYLAYSVLDRIVKTAKNEALSNVINHVEFMKE